MARHRSPRVEKHWDLLVQMQGLIDSGVTTPHGAAVTVATEHWREITPKGKYESAIWWLQHNQRKFRDELKPWSAVVDKMRAAREERLSKLTPQERKVAERLYEELRRGRYHPAAPKKKIEWRELFRLSPKWAVQQLLLDELKTELLFEVNGKVFDD
jgi:hypothetical protein